MGGFVDGLGQPKKSWNETFSVSRVLEDEFFSEIEGDTPEEPNHLRHHEAHGHLHGAFGGDSFGKVSEAIARFFGTPKFIVIQTVIVAAWIVWNVVGGRPFDPYPFVFLNLVFSTQAAYASPFILLASSRQAERDKAQEEADAKHREELAQASSQRLDLLHELMRQNTELTEQVANLTREVHGLVAKKE